MQTKSLSKIYGCLLAMGIFFFGFQQTADAQFRILNNTGCTVNLWIGQGSGGCTPCLVSPVVSIPSTGFYQHPVGAGCGIESWVAFRYFIGGIAPSPGPVSFGQHFNPDLACGPDTPGTCPSTGLVTANWFTNGSGTGPVTVILN